MAGSSKKQELPPQTYNEPKLSSTYKALTFLNALSSLFFIAFVASMIKLSIETAFKGKKGFAQGVGGCLKFVANFMGGICGVVAGTDLTRDDILQNPKEGNNKSGQDQYGNTVGKGVPSTNIHPLSAAGALDNGHEVGRV
jgi:hypothetical protein